MVTKAHPVRGRCVLAAKDFFVGELVGFYEGEKIPAKEGNKRNKDYSVDEGSYILFLPPLEGKKWAIDPTKMEKYD